MKFAMNDLPKLNFPAIRLRARKTEGRIEVWDEVRGMYLVLTPEEWVRQHTIAYLTAYCGADVHRIVEEYPVRLNGQAQRADIVVVDNEAKPLMVVECKAPEITISQQTFMQVVRYNSVLGARYVAMTNGLQHFCYASTKGGYSRMTTFPRLDR